jgi:hypothetical protein
MRKIAPGGQEGSEVPPMTVSPSDAPPSEVSYKEVTIVPRRDDFADEQKPKSFANTPQV